MQLRFDPFRLIGNIVLAAAGSGVAMVVVFLVSWKLAGEGAAITFGTTASTLLVGFFIITPLVLPAAVLLTGAAYLIKFRLPVMEPGGFSMTLLLGILGILLDLFLVWIFGLNGNGEFGRYLLLSASIGGACCGIIVAWRTSK